MYQDEGITEAKIDQRQFSAKSLCFSEEGRASLKCGYRDLSIDEQAAYELKATAKNTAIAAANRTVVSENKRARLQLCQPCQPEPHSPTPTLASLAIADVGGGLVGHSALAFPSVSHARHCQRCDSSTVSLRHATSLPPFAGMGMSHTEIGISDMEIVRQAADVELARTRPLSLSRYEAYIQNAGVTW